jgi:ribosomal protein L7/L12
MGVFGSNDGDAARLARIERKLDALLAQLNVAVPEDDMDDIRDLVAAGKKITAIKEYRARTGAGLAEAKKAIEEGI